MHFVYINANARIAAHSLINISRSEHHIQGICTQSHSVKTYLMGSGQLHLDSEDE
ncbi:hypothetical protein [Citrobacter sp. JGM124]|uniref:hypothetical protein n=1 Tax=Citrobacter sp. JGM124 TaxID=2799789 RepID=UPI001BA81920|nr:hypothetical protein [Citrobacter sp. JGM124]MBS0847746.1 hypothetical protein [Citrobacter sp. JGM124]